MIPYRAPPRLLGSTPKVEPYDVTLDTCAARWSAYRSAQVDMTIDPSEDMIVREAGGIEHYREVGLRALELLTDAMILSGRPHAPRILDLPCGGGRVTRHLVQFFPESDVVVSDVDGAKVAAVTRQFGVRAIAASPEFAAPLGERFDLIFVGSLLTHFDEVLYIRALDVLVEALEPGGVLILTTTGRSWASEALDGESKAGLPPQAPWSPALKWLTGGRYRASSLRAAIEGGYAKRGFGYSEVRSWTQLYGRSYGSSFASPSWLMRQVERRPDARILAFKERGYDHLLDALLVQRLG